MEYNTKFEIGDEVFLILDNKVTTKKITGINLSVYADCSSETYLLNYDDVKYPAESLFKTKKELIESLRYEGEV